MASVVVENLTKTFKGSNRENVQAVNGVGLTVADGELLVLVGPSGCGKTTTLRLIAGLEDATGGTITIDGKPVNSVPAKDRDIAMVFQHSALFPQMTARENLAFGLKLRRHPRAEIEQRVAEAADLLGLADCLDRRPGELSGGQRQRVALGRALVRKPKVFLFDEPLSNLDAQMRVQMRREIAKLHSRLGATMIYVTHDQVEALTLGDRVAVMRGGALQQVAAPMELYERPENLFVAGFIGSPPMNFFNGMLTSQADGIFFETGTAPAFKMPLNGGLRARLNGFADKKAVLGIRPEHITELNGSAETPERCRMEATVQEIEPMGPEAVLYAASGASTIAARIRTGSRAVAGDRVSLLLDARQVHLFDPATERVI
jgi:multiple sugar transport system ATP-binding protein